MSTLMKRLVTLENLSEEGGLNATADAVEAAEIATDVADGNAEVAVDATEIDSLDTGIENAFDAAEAVEELQENAQETVADGGMTPEHAKSIEIAHESIMAGLGMSHRKTNYSRSPIVSLESYGSSQTRMSSTMVTIEGLGDSLKNIARIIVDALKAAWNTVSNFFVGLLRNRALMEKHLKNLQAKVKAIPSASKAKESKFKGSIANALRGDGVANYQTALGILTDASAMVKMAIGVSSIVANFKPEFGWIDQTSKAVEKSVTTLGKSGDHEGSVAYGFLTRGRAIVLKTSESADTPTTFSLVETRKKADEIVAPTASEMTGMLDKALAVLAELRAFERGQKDLQKGSELAIAAVSKIATGNANMADPKNEEVKKEIKESQKAGRLAVSTINKLGASVPAAAFDAVKSAADYVNAGINNFKSEKKEEKKA